jgi:F0F1-type ATP synthase epsilon subunit
MSTFQLTINTPEIVLFAGQVYSISLPTASGIQTYLAEHWDSVVDLDIGIVEIMTENNETIKIAINAGIATFADNNLILSTIEGQILTGRKPNLDIFPATIKAQQDQINQKIKEALQAGGVFETQNFNLASLMNEERMAKVQILNEIIKGK